MGISETTGEFFNTRPEKLSQAIQQVFEAMTTDLDPADVLGLGLFSDGDGMSIVAAIYTRAGHEANLEQYSAPEYQQEPYASFDWDLYLRWYPGEWDRNTTIDPTPASEPLERLWDEMRDYREHVGAEDQTYWPSLPFETVAIAMGYLQDDGWYDSRFPGSIRNFAIMDMEVPADDLSRWGQWVNGPEALDGLSRYIMQETSED